MSVLPATVTAGSGATGAVNAVSVISTGTVRIHPEHPYGTRKPLYWWPFRRGNAADERRQIGAARASAARRGVSFSAATCAAGRLSVSHRTPNTARPGRTT